jgi:hypothetical protein
MMETDSTRPPKPRRKNRPRKPWIRIDMEVHKFLEAHRQSVKESHSDILARLLKIEPADRSDK